MPDKRLTCVDYDPVNSLCLGSVDSLHDSSFVITLKGTAFTSRCFCRLFALGLDVAQSVIAISLRFPSSEQVEVGTVDDEYVNAGHFLWLENGNGGKICLRRIREHTGCSPVNL